MEKLDPNKDSAAPGLVADNIERMWDLFPDIFTEEKIDFDVLRETLRVVFRDASFADDVIKTNTVQILWKTGIDDVKSL